MTRRSFLRLAALSPMLGALSSLQPALYPQVQPEPDLRMWWWGEEEANGLTRWVDDTLAQFRADTGLTIASDQMATDAVVDQFAEAAAAGNPPDIQFLWNGIYHMENVWRGYLEPLNGLVSRNVLQRSGATRLSVFEGKQYRAGSVAEAWGMAYNKDLFDRAGLNADDPPRTWEALLNVCDRLRGAGIVPFGGGVKDGFFGDWFFTQSLIQNLNAPAEAISLFIGDLDWREPRYHEHWVHLQELYRLGFLNGDIGELEHFEGLAAFEAGRFAMCLYTSPLLPHTQERLGRGRVGFMLMPVFGRGRLAGVPIVDSHGFGIPRAARDKRNAARFIEFMHTKERLQAMWQLSSQIPADEAFDPSVIDDPLMTQVYRSWIAEPHTLLIDDLVPVKFWTDVMFVASQRILAGQFTGEQAGDLAYAVTEAWRSENPDMVNNYARWGRELGL